MFPSVKIRLTWAHVFRAERGFSHYDIFTSCHRGYIISVYPRVGNSQFPPKNTLFTQAYGLSKLLTMTTRTLIGIPTLGNIVFWTKSLIIKINMTLTLKPLAGGRERKMLVICELGRQAIAPAPSFCNMYTLEYF